MAIFSKTIPVRFCGMSLRLLSTWSGFALRAIILLFLCQPVAQAQERNLSVTQTNKRVALVIGNTDYTGLPLKNPVNDARAIAAKLQRLGFDVVKRENLTAKQIGSTLREFRSKLSPGSEALFFYAGHGLQVKGTNYLPAVDADITSEEDVPNQSLNLSQILDLMEEAKTRLNLIFLDACRNNPFTRRFRSAGGGLAKIEAPSGTKISFATRPGSVAADGEGSNGLYTEHLLKVMDEKGLPIEQALKRVYSGVKVASKGAQEPWEEGTIVGEFFFQPGSGPQVAQLGPGIGGTARTPEQLEDDLWDSIKNGDKARVFEEYIKQYPNGRYLAQARVKLAGINTTNQPASVTSISSPRYQPAEARVPSSPPRIIATQSPVPVKVKCTTTEVENNGYFEVETDAENKTIEVRIVSKRDGGFGEAFRSNGSQYYFDGIIQKGRQLSASAKVENVNSATALVSFEPNYNGMYSIPAGVMRILTLSRIPSWFDFTAPTQGVVWGNRSYRCLSE